WATRSFAAVLFLAATSVVVGLLSVEQGGGTSGSIALIPFTAALLIAPDLRSVLSIAGAAVVVQTIRRKPWQKGLFNVTQSTASAGIAVLAFRQLGGQPFEGLEGV